MRGRFRSCLVVMSLCVVPVGAAAQQTGAGQTEDCVIRTSPTATQSFYNNGELAFFGGGATFICRDGRRIRADSVERFRSTGVANFIGRVRYQDDENVLTANYVRYLERERQATAQGNVVLTERASGSVVRGPFLHYFEATDTRPEALIQLPQGRPHATLVQSARADTTQRDTIDVDADGMEMVGRGRFSAQGNVILVRSDLKGTGGRATYDRETGNLRLWMQARLETEEYTLTADTITGTTSEADELERLDAIADAVLDAEDVDVRAPRIAIEFKDGEVNRLIAVGKPPMEGAGADPRTQAVAVSENFQIAADSIDALAPGRQLEKVIAVGRAYGERLNPDLGNANVPAIATRDWMRGDTIITTFVAAAPDTAAGVEAPDSARGREVESVVAIGVTDRASSLYRMEDEEDPTAPVAISYTLARRIHVQMKDGEVASVNASVEVQGLHLEPFQRTSADTTTTAASRSSNRRGPR